MSNCQKETRGCNITQEIEKSVPEIQKQTRLVPLRQAVFHSYYL